MQNLKTHKIEGYATSTGALYDALSVSYQIYGRALNTAPIVLVIHALTGNSDVMSTDKGWWSQVVGDSKLIDINTYTVIAFNIPGNGYDGTLIDRYKDFTAKDIAILFHLVLRQLNVGSVYAIIGGSLGGGIAWEMLSIFPKFSSYVIPIASDWRSSDWSIGHNFIQESILLNSRNPIEDARKMAMLFYRTPESLDKKFRRSKTEDERSYNVESWLRHHGEKLTHRFELKAYLLMNHLLSSIDIASEGKTFKNVLSDFEGAIIQIGVSSDLLFSPHENIKTKGILDELNIRNEYHEIQSIDGHDAFLIEHEQITNFLTPIFSLSNS